MRSLVFAAFLTLAASSGLGSNDLPFFGRATFRLTTSAQAVDLRQNGSRHPYKFDEHTDTTEGFALDELVLDATNGRRESFLSITARDAGQRDQQFVADVGIFGAWRASASFDGFPQVYTTTARSPFSYLGAGRMAVDEAMRRELETVSDDDLALSAHRIATQAPLTRVGFQRNRLAGGARWTPLDWLVIRATARDEMRNGTRPFSIGSFDISGPAVAPQLSILMFEFPERIEVRTNEFTFGTTVRGRAWHLDVDASAMRFRNTITDIDYDNPFRITHAAATPDGLANRMRAPRGIATSSPDSAAQSVRASGHVNLGARARVGASVTWIDMHQDQRFAPWTLNLAIQGSGLPEGLGPVNTEALPRASLEGRANVLATDDSVAFMLRRNLTLTLRYRDYDFTNETPELPMPGYAGGGDAYWRTEFAGEPIVAAARSYRRQVAQTELVWHRGAMRGRVSHEREIWTRQQRQRARTEQDAVTAALHFRSRDLSGSATVRHARRDGNAAVDPAALLRFDAGDRTHSDGRVRLQWTPSERIGVTAAVSGLSDDYDQARIGLQRFEAYDGAVDVRLRIFSTSEIIARLARHSIGYGYTLLTPGSVDERRGRDVDDVSNSAVVEYDTTAGRFSIHLGYEREAGRQSMSDRPRVTTDLQQVRADVHYELTPHWRVGLRYRYEPYSLDDYATNGLSPYPLDVLSPEIDARRVFLLDARYGGHEAHVLALYFRLASN